MDIWKQIVNELFVGSPVEDFADQHKEERRRVHRAVIGAERHLSSAGHLALALLMNDLAWLFVAPVIHFIALMPSENTQGFIRKMRIQYERLISSDDRVASENGGEPRD